MDPARYFDYAATSPMLPEAVAAYAVASERYYGNPSSPHSPGHAAREALYEAKDRICAAVSFSDGRLVLTSGGTESNNLVVEGFCAAEPEGLILLAEDVHPSLWYAAERHPDRVRVLRLGDSPKIDAGRVRETLDGVGLVVCSHICNETGLRHDVRGIAELCHRKGVRCHVDGTQALGHVAVDLDAIPCDSYAFSAHKFGGPRGVGGLFLREGRLEPILRGGGQEWHLRAGTENVAGCLATAEALAVSCARREAEEERLRRLAAQLLDGLAGMERPPLVNGDPATGLPGLVSCSATGISGHAAVTELDLRGFALATGSACHADRVEPSRVILALGRDQEQALGTLRISMGFGTTPEAVADLAGAVRDVIAAQRPA